MGFVDTTKYVYSIFDYLTKNNTHVKKKIYTNIYTWYRKKNHNVIKKKNNDYIRTFSIEKFEFGIHEHHNFFKSHALQYECLL